MEYLTELIATGAGVLGVGGVLFSKLRGKIKLLQKLAVQLFEAYQASAELKAYVLKAKDDGWTPEEGAKAGALAVKLADELDDVRGVLGQFR